VLLGDVSNEVNISVSGIGVDMMLLPAVGQHMIFIIFVRESLVEQMNLTISSQYFAPTTSCSTHFGGSGINKERNDA